MTEHVLEIDITQFYESLLKLDTNSEAAFIAKAVYLKSVDKFTSSRECLSRVISLNAQSFWAWALLSQVYRKLYCWEEIENASKQTIKLMEYHLKDQLNRRLELTLVEAMSRSSDKYKLIQARQMCEEVSLISIVCHINFSKFSST